MLFSFQIIVYWVAVWSPDGIDLMMSESPGSVILKTETLKYFPQAVPSSMLLPV